MAAAVPPAGALYANPPIPADFGNDPRTVTAVVPNATLATCYAVTTGPDRNLYWVYGHMPQTATAIPLGTLVPPTCFETQQSMATSQNKTRPRQLCVTCGRSVSQHATVAQATAAFNAHATAFPATHAMLTAPVGPGVSAPLGYAAANGITAPIAAAVAVPY